MCRQYCMRLNDLLVMYLKFKFKWVSCLLFGNPHLRLSCVMVTGVVGVFLLVFGGCPSMWCRPLPYSSHIPGALLKAKGLLEVISRFVCVSFRSKGISTAWWKWGLCPAFLSPVLLGSLSSPGTEGPSLQAPSWGGGESDTVGGWQGVGGRNGGPPHRHRWGRSGDPQGTPQLQTGLGQAS